MDAVEDPAIMLDQARRDMAAIAATNKERAVNAITQRNNLQRMYDEAKAKSASSESKASAALKQGNQQLALVYMKEKQSNDAMVANLEQSVAKANQAVELVKASIAHQEEEFRKKTAEALVLKANYKAAQAQDAIAKALGSMDTTGVDAINSTWGTAAEKIGNMQSQAAARMELQGNSLQGQIYQLEDASHDAAAQDELTALAARLGLATPAAADGLPVTATTATTSAEDELNKLSQRLSTGA